MRLIVILFWLQIIYINISAQYKLVSEEIKSNKLIIELESQKVEYNFTDKSPGSKKQIIFSEYIDESNPGSINIPKTNLYIAIPFYEKPQVIFQVLEKENIDAYPFLNPEMHITKEGEIILNNIDYNQIKTIPPFKNNGIVTVDNYPCLFLTLNVFDYDMLKSHFVYNKKIRIELIFSKNIPQVLPTSNSDLFINSRFVKKEIKFDNTDDSTSIWIDYTRQYLKFGLANDGIYRINYNDIKDIIADINTIDPTTIQLFWRGKEFPIFISGENDNKFDVDDYIEFAATKNYDGNHRIINPYNTPYNEYLNRYSDSTFVWMTWGKQKGKRIQKLNSNHGTASQTINYYNHLIHEEKNVWFDFSVDNLVRRQMPDWIENETWMWRTQSVGSMNLSFSVSNIVLNKPARAFIKLQSYASDRTKNSHRVGLSINNYSKVYDSLYFDSYKQRLISANYSSSLLTNGTNNLKCISFPTSASLNSVIHDWYEIEYPRLLRLENDTLNFYFNDYTSSSFVNYEIDNYNKGNISIYKFKDMLSCSKIENYISDNTKIIFSDITDSTYQYFITNNFLKPKIYGVKNFVNLRKDDNIEHIIISHKNLSSSAEEYKNFLATEYSKKVKLVYIDDLYDEFNYGYSAPEPIKYFLKNVFNSWGGKKYEYVLFLGSANYDYYLNRTRELPSPYHPNLVPSYGVPVSDNWFVMWDSLGIINTKIKIGRIPARTNEDVYNYLNRHKQFVKNVYSAINKRFLFFSGGLGNNESELTQLKSVNNFVINNYVAPAPIGGQTTHFYKTLSPSTNFGPYTPLFIKNAIDSSGLFISYLGHSGTQTWDNSITEVKQLKNSSGAFPLISDFGCSTAKFAEPDVTSFGELFVNSSDGQSIGYIGNSSLGFLSTSILAPKLFYKIILKDSVYNISEALLKSKKELIKNYGSSAVNQLFCLTNTLIGDPIISLPIPTKPNLKNGEKIIQKPLNALSSDDSLKVIVPYLNLGRVDSLNYKINIKHIYQGNIIYENNYSRMLPNYQDSLVLLIGIKNKNGEHTLVLTLDSDNTIDEINENDNGITYKFFVSSTTIRSMASYSNESSLNSLKIINPITKGTSEKIYYQVSDNSKFIQPMINTKTIDDVSTEIVLPNLNPNKRHWIRAKLDGEIDYSINSSFTYSQQKGYFLNDSISFSSGLTDKTNISNVVELAKDKISFEAISAGFNDGNTAVITKNNQNYIPFPHRGHNVCIFDGNTYEFKSYSQFDLLFGGASARSNYKNLLDTLKNNDLIIITIVDEGSVNLDQELRQKLRGIGSRYVDSIGFRDSWSIIGKKNSPIGSVPESYVKIFKGRAIANSTYEKIYDEGFYTSSLIGPASRWNYIKINDEGEKNIYKLISIKPDGKKDTLNIPIIPNVNFDLSSLNLSSSFLQLMVKLKSTSGKESFLKSVFVSYNGLPELAINYQTVKVDKDTLQQGENSKIDVKVYNIGESTAKNFSIKIDFINHTGKRETVFQQMVDSLESGKSILLSTVYNTQFANGLCKYEIYIDSADTVDELYEDNNFYSVPIFIKQDESLQNLSLTFDGENIYDGDYISSRPDIKIELSNDSILPVADTTAVALLLNNKLITYKNNEAELKYNYSITNPKMTIHYTPNLSEGDYELTVKAKNIYNNSQTIVSLSKKFIVSNRLFIADVYNYPNPFADETYFTFKITKIPGEISIKIYTLAGRLIRVLKPSIEEIKHDFNRIHWDGRDEDGDQVGNGVYLYKVIMKRDSETIESINKLAIVR